MSMLASSEPLTSPELVTGDLHCIHCDYNVRMQPTDGRCPECGAAIVDTLNFPRLARSAPRWLTSLCDSTTLLLVGWLLFAAFLGTWPRAVAQAIAVTVPWALCWMAVWMLTRREPKTACRRNRIRDHVWAWLLRISALGTILVFCGAGWIIFGSVCTVLTTLVYFLHLRWRALRLPSRGLALLATIVDIHASALSGAYLFLQYYVPVWFYDPGRIIIAHPLPILCWPASLPHFVQLMINGLSFAGSYPLRLLMQGIVSAAVAATLLAFRIAFARAARFRREMVQ